MKKIKCVAVGDKGIGRFTLLDNFTKEHTFDTIGERYTAYIELGDTTVHLVLRYAPVEDHYSQLRTGCEYPEADGFVVCFSIVDPTSFQNVKSKWYPEITEYRPNVPFIVVGTRVDLREDKDTLENLKKNNTEPISYELGKAMAKDIGAIGYFECSGVTQEGTAEAFRQLANVVRHTLPKTIE